MVKPGSVKKLVYIPKLGFLDDIWSAIGEESPKDNQSQIQQETSRELTKVDQIILKRLQKEYPGCKIIHNGNRWEVVPEK